MWKLHAVQRHPYKLPMAHCSMSFRIRLLQCLRCKPVRKLSGKINTLLKWEFGLRSRRCSKHVPAESVTCTQTCTPHLVVCLAVPLLMMYCMVSSHNTLMQVNPSRPLPLFHPSHPSTASWSTDSSLCCNSGLFPVFLSPSRSRHSARSLLRNTETIDWALNKGTGREARLSCLIVIMI